MPPACRKRVKFGKEWGLDVDFTGSLALPSFMMAKGANRAVQTGAVEG